MRSPSRRLLPAGLFSDEVRRQLGVRQYLQIFRRWKGNVEPSLESWVQLLSLLGSDAEAVADPLHTQPDQAVGLGGRKVNPFVIEAPNLLRSLHVVYPQVGVIRLLCAFPAELECADEFSRRDRRRDQPGRELFPDLSRRVAVNSDVALVVVKG